MNPALGILQSITSMIAKRSEVLVIFVVIGIIFMMILPLPTGLVDALIALNISASALMVVIVMYMPGPLAFSTFPAILLVTTLFRLALSITTTRLILLQGDAGQIVEAFGEFVVGGNLVVGLVIFSILTIVNFMVITKGSERVAEVSARFTLDAMPGKQMSIDGDLRAGLIDAQEAQQKRADVGRESQLFGAMDGAMKFVKGDAVAGIIIVIVNILGGFSIGVAQLDLPANEAIQVYAILTIGDGLVAQIPAILISITAGMIITRVSDPNETDTNVGRDMAKQLSSEPKAWIIAAIVMLGFALVPGMPFMAFVCFALLFGSCGAYQIFRKFQDAKAAYAKALEGQASPASAPNISYNNGEDDLRVFAPYEKLSISAKNIRPENTDFHECLKAVRRARNKIVLEKGYTIPAIEIIPGPHLEEGAVVVSINGVEKITENFVTGNYAVNTNKTTEEGIEYLIKTGIDPVLLEQSGSYIWLTENEKQKAENKGVETYTFDECIYVRMHELLLRESPQFIGIEEASKILAWLASESDKLSEELQRCISVPKFSEILQGLAKDSISIRSIRRIAEVIVENSNSERSIQGLIDAVRFGLREQICNELARENVLNIYLFDSETEEKLRGYVRNTPSGDFIELPIDEREKLFSSLKAALKKAKNIGTLVVAQDIRRLVRNMLQADLFNLPILSTNELTENISVVPKERLSLYN